MTDFVLMTKFEEKLVYESYLHVKESALRIRRNKKTVRTKVSKQKVVYGKIFYSFMTEFRFTDLPTKGCRIKHNHLKHLSDLDPHDAMNTQNCACCLDASSFTMFRVILSFRAQMMQNQILYPPRPYKDENLKIFCLF